MLNPTAVTGSLSLDDLARWTRDVYFSSDVLNECFRLADSLLQVAGQASSIFGSSAHGFQVPALVRVKWTRRNEHGELPVGQRIGQAWKGRTPGLPAFYWLELWLPWRGTFWSSGHGERK